MRQVYQKNNSYWSEIWLAKDKVLITVFSSLDAALQHNKEFKYGTE